MGKKKFRHTRQSLDEVQTLEAAINRIKELESFGGGGPKTGYTREEAELMNKVSCLEQENRKLQATLDFYHADRQALRVTVEQLAVLFAKEKQYPLISAYGVIQKQPGVGDGGKLCG